MIPAVGFGRSPHAILAPTLRNMKKHLPNFLTMGRIILAPPVVALLCFPGKLASAAAAFLFLAASLTDFFDGFIARRMGTESSFGRFLDPIADKVLVTSALVMLVNLDRVEAWVAAIIVAREVAVSGLRALTKSWNTTLAPSPAGKLKAVAQFTAIVPLMLHYTYNVGIPIDFHALGTILMYIALALTVWSGIDYFVRFYRVYETGESENERGI